LYISSLNREIDAVKMKDLMYKRTGIASREACFIFENQYLKQNSGFLKVGMKKLNLPAEYLK
jgi:hypothetical protein